MHLFIATTSVCLATIAQSAMAAPPVTDIIDADATWMLHVDLETAVQTELGRAILDQDDDDFKIDFGSEFEEFTTGLGIICGEDVLSMSAYGTDGHEDDADGTLVFFGSAKLDLWRKHLLETKDARKKTLELSGRSLQVLFTPELETWDAILPAGQNNRFWVTTDNEDTMVRALGVLLGEHPSLAADTTLIPPGGVHPGTIAYFAGSDLHQLSDFDPTSEIAQQAKSMWISFGQHESDAFLDATITANSADDANSIADLLRGFVALGRLSLGKDEEIGDEVNALLDGMTFGSDGPHVHVTLVYDAAKICSLAEKVD